jgi:hypothetical protein
MRFKQKPNVTRDLEYLGDPSCQAFTQKIISWIDHHKSEPTTHHVYPSNIQNNLSFVQPPSPAQSTPGHQAENQSSQKKKQPYYVFVDSIPHQGPLTIHLPPQEYSLNLLKVIEERLGSISHSFLRRTLHRKVTNMFKFPTKPESKSRAWLCRWLALIAIGELYGGDGSKCKTGPGNYSTNPAQKATDRRDGAEEGSAVEPPGIEYFRNSVGLLPGPSEEPNLDYVEVLCLLAYYSHSLNRQTTAYTYIGLALRVSLTLGLHRQPRRDDYRDINPWDGMSGRVEQEHKNRVWWTVYYLNQ